MSPVPPPWPPKAAAPPMIAERPPVPIEPAMVAPPLAPRVVALGAAPPAPLDNCPLPPAPVVVLPVPSELPEHAASTKGAASTTQAGLCAAKRRATCRRESPATRHDECAKMDEFEQGILLPLRIVDMGISRDQVEVRHSRASIAARVHVRKKRREGFSANGLHHCSAAPTNFRQTKSRKAHQPADASPLESSMPGAYRQTVRRARDVKRRTQAWGMNCAKTCVCHWDRSAVGPPLMDARGSAHRHLAPSRTCVPSTTSAQS